MYMKVFPHGQGDGYSPTHYLVRPDYPGRDELPPEILRGDVETTRALINSLDTVWKFTAGVLSWHPGDRVTPEQEQRVMDDFERVAFAGLEPDQRNILWVRHSHAGHHELHFVIPRVELANGKAFNPCPPGWQKDFDVFRDLYNHREGWARPDDPARARLHIPDHADLRKARLIRWGQASRMSPGKDGRAEAKEGVHAYLTAKLEQGLVRNREDVVSALREAGLEINRAGKEYITVKDPESGEKLRLKGGIYGEQWNFTEFTGRAHQGEDRAGRQGDRESDPETVRQLEQELGRILAKRAQYNRRRYPQQYRGIGEEHHFPLPAPRGHLQPEMSLRHAPEWGDSGGDHAHLLGADNPVPSPDNGLTPGSGGTQGREGGMGQRLSAAATGLSRPHAAQTGRQELSDTAGRHDGPRRRGIGETGSMGNREEISHDRTGTDTQRHIDPAGAGFFSFPVRPEQGITGAKTTYGCPEPGVTEVSGGNDPDEGRFASLDAALGRLDRIVRELGAALVAFERYVERQIARAGEREHERQRNRGLGLKM